MARYCAACGKKISPFENPYEMEYSGHVFCSDCGKTVSELLMIGQLKSTYDDPAEKWERFSSALEQTAFDKDVRDVIKNEFSHIVAAVPDNFVSLTNIYANTFDECKEAVIRAGRTIGDLRFSAVAADRQDLRAEVFTFYGHSVMLEISAFLTAVVTGGDGDVTTVRIGGADYIGILDVERMKGNAPSRFVKALEAEGLTRLKPRTGVLGGTFDPVHLAHVALAKAAIEEAHLDRLIIMPARIQPFKFGKKIAEDHHRKAMAELAFEGNEKIEVSDYELAQPGISYTINTLEHLKEIYPDNELFFICGTDSFLEMEKWRMGEDIIKDFSLAVSVRPGYRQEELCRKISEYERKYAAHIIRINAQMPPISSTAVRERLRQGKAIADLVPKEVERYIIENGLYR